MSAGKIEPTLTLKDAASRPWDVIVVGAGPAGSAAAIELGKRQLRVLLVDKSNFPRWKVCGCCLSAWGLSALKTLGLKDLQHNVKAPPLTEIKLGVRGKSASLPLKGGVAISRMVLDAALVRQAIASNVSFLPATMASLIDPSAPSIDLPRRISLKQDTEEVLAAAPVLLVADGLGGKTLENDRDLPTFQAPDSLIGVAATSRGGLLEQVPPGVLLMAIGQAGYVGIVRLEDGKLDLAAAISPEASQEAKGPSQLIRSLLEETGFPIPSDFAFMDWQGTPRLTRHREKVAARRLLVLGDAASYVEPFTGEGMSWALWSGITAAKITADAGPKFAAGFESKWEVEHVKLLQKRQKLCSTISMLLRKPGLTKTVIGALNHAPWLARPIIRAISHG